MADYSIYIHLPFCESKCPYCDFHSVARANPPFAAYREALQNEWRTNLLHHFGDGAPLSVYLGGGTPSIWPAEELLCLLDALPTTTGEVTVEVNPGSLGPTWLRELRTGGVNRVSIGVQALDDSRLRMLGRRHSAVDAHRALLSSQEAGFSAISADIIYGTPGQIPAALETELCKLLSARPHHVSAYELTYAEETPFGAARRLGAMHPLDESPLIALWRTTRDVLGSAGLELYEISNYAIPGFESRHNRNYWLGGAYAGLGSGAHGFITDGSQAVRYANTPDIETYIAMWTGTTQRSDSEAFQSRKSECLTQFDLAKERMMLGLRTTKGVDLTDVLAMVPEPDQERWTVLAKRMAFRGLAHLRDGRLEPTEAGLLLGDAIAEEFF